MTRRPGGKKRKDLSKRLEEERLEFESRLKMRRNAFIYNFDQNRCSYESDDFFSDENILSTMMAEVEIMILNRYGMEVPMSLFMLGGRAVI